MRRIEGEDVVKWSEICRSGSPGLDPVPDEDSRILCLDPTPYTLPIQLAGTPPRLPRTGHSRQAGPGRSRGFRKAESDRRPRRRPQRIGGDQCLPHVLTQGDHRPRGREKSRPRPLPGRQAYVPLTTRPGGEQSDGDGCLCVTVRYVPG